MLTPTFLPMFKYSTKRTSSVTAYSHSMAYNATDKTFIHPSLRKGAERRKKRSFQDLFFERYWSKACQTYTTFIPALKVGPSPRCMSINSCYSRPVLCRGARASSQYSAITATGKFWAALPLQLWPPCYMGGGKWAFDKQNQFLNVYIFFWSSKKQIDR